MVYRTEHPNPQFERENWLCLNGHWEFQRDPSVSGAERGLQHKDAVYSERINVPFCMESQLSGIGATDFINSVWYRRQITVTPEQLAGRVILHFGAVDYLATAYVNGQKAGTHKGGYVSFSFDITEYLAAGENTIVLNAVDDTRSDRIPTGKQSTQYGSYSCYYTRTTGIWQSVWLEFLPLAYIKGVRYVTDTDNATVTVTARLEGAGEFRAEAFFEGRPVGSAAVQSRGGTAVLTLPLTEKHLWQVGEGKLYDLLLTYGGDTVKSYVGLRSVSVSGNKVLINGKSVFQRLVLDQGFYPDGIYTAPSEEDLVGDIQRSLAMGFNGARLHQKVFEPRFLYHCDRLGYIVWGEYPSWGLNDNLHNSIYGILPEWLEVVERDFNHPAIVTWCPMNECWNQFGVAAFGAKPCADLLRLIYLATKAADPTRPCIDSSGGLHFATDIYDLHDYQQDTAIFASHYENLPGQIGEFRTAFLSEQSYDGKMPFCVSEYGGIAWSMEKGGWGYGKGPQTEAEFIQRFRELTDTLLDNEHIFGLCYTQLTDVEQEQNGLYFYDRRAKFDATIFHRILSRKAAIED